MSEPPAPRLKQTFDKFSGSFRFDPHAVRLRSEIQPTLPPALAAEVAQSKQKPGYVRRDLGTRADDVCKQWQLPAQYAQPLIAPATPVTSTETTPNTANTGTTGLSLAPRYDTPPPEPGFAPPPSPLMDDVLPMSLEDFSGLTYVENATSATISQMEAENAKIEAVYKKRKHLNDLLEEQVSRTKFIYKEHVDLCEKMHAEVPVYQTRAQEDLQKVKVLITKYKEDTHEIIFKRWRLDDLLRTERLSFVEDTVPTSRELEGLELKPRPTSAEAFAALDEVDSRPSSPEPMTLRGFSINNMHLHPSALPDPDDAEQRMQAIRRVIDEFKAQNRHERVCPWCQKPIGSFCNLKNHVASRLCYAPNKPTNEELASL